METTDKSMKLIGGVPIRPALSHALKHLKDGSPMCENAPSAKPLAGDRNEQALHRIPNPQ